MRPPPSSRGCGRERVFDFYCGIGTIALALALALDVIGVESIERAVADAIANAQRNGVDNARFFAGDVRTAMRRAMTTRGRRSPPPGPARPEGAPNGNGQINSSPLAVVPGQTIHPLRRLRERT